ncbi:MAG TPA: pyridoxal phosphate-dependent aminotransferase [Vicinamibacterales bacterium]|nr:pyridoxal phosphate-dependent aminotransferase [Vicinamibacterales bacterium]
MFSRRVPDDRAPNRLSRAIADARAHGQPLLDLTCSNPTAVGIAYPGGLLEVLADPRGLAYRPEPFGLLEARVAVARELGRRGLDISPGRIILTASTSEAYSLLFKLLCDAGESAILTPAPSYPLFDHLARLDAVRQAVYRLEYQGRWGVDPSALDEAWTPDVRGVLAVSPNNPTGSVLNDEDAHALVSRCQDRDAALIVDEVFCDYLFEPVSTEPASLRRRECLLFRLGGLSKTVGLPQLKLGWIAVDGPDELVREALDRLELICDTYLSVSTPVQIAAPALLSTAADVRSRILDRVRGNRATLAHLAAGVESVALLPSDGGWSAVLRVPATRGEEQLALALLAEDGVIVHPGFFFDFPHEAFVVVSLLPEPEAFACGIGRVLERARAA